MPDTTDIKIKKTLDTLDLTNLQIKQHGFNSYLMKLLHHYWSANINTLTSIIMWMLYIWHYHKCYQHYLPFIACLLRASTMLRLPETSFSLLNNTMMQELLRPFPTLQNRGSEIKELARIQSGWITILTRNSKPQKCDTNQVALKKYKESSPDLFLHFPILGGSGHTEYRLDPCSAIC